MVGQLEEAEDAEKVVAVGVLVVLAKKQFSERILKASDESVFVVDEEAIVEEGQLALYVGSGILRS